MEGPYDLRREGKLPGVVLGTDGSGWIALRQRLVQRLLTNVDTVLF
jgi:hypothetical protein